jgi:hypothetical protein
MTNIVWDFNNKITSKENVAACVGAGWKPLVETLIDDLLNLGWDGRIFDVKEKFGGLRFYINNGSKEIFNRIERAEIESTTICEVCGEPGKLRNHSWIKTLCDTHDKERTERYSSFGR